jgi:hypothetical protein
MDKVQNSVSPSFIPDCALRPSLLNQISTVYLSESGQDINSAHTDINLYRKQREEGDKFNERWQHLIWSSYINYTVQVY